METQVREPTHPSQVIVRPAVANDIDDILGMVPDLVSFGPPPWRDREQMVQTDSEVICRAVLDQSEDAAVFVATVADRVIAFLHARSVVEYYSQMAQGHVADLVVADDARGLGIGSHLLGHAEDWAKSRGFQFLTIAVFERNQDALRLYERSGFQREIVRLIKPLASQANSCITSNRKI